jgi:hypothetical protein
MNGMFGVANFFGTISILIEGGNIMSRTSAPQCSFEECGA